MDLMKTLLIYMTATMTLAVQSTTAPQVTPTPSPVPVETAIVQQGENPGDPDAEITFVLEVTPEPAKETMTPFPVLQITPNTKGYHNLGMGGKGKEVKRLQEKLIELRYMPEGTADGAYGRQTYNAVKKFQKYNGLTADGIAGRRTQTNLFENPDAARNPEVTPTPAPETAAPAETEAPETIAPPVTEAPEKAGPTEAPEETETPEESEAAEESEAPEETEAPEAGEAPGETGAPGSAEPAVETENPEDGEPDIIENVDLDAEVYEPLVAAIALNEGDGPLEFVETVDGVPKTARPRLSQNSGKIRVSLDDLCKCVGTWQLTDDGVGSVVLEAAGYTLALYNDDNGCSATVDGKEISMKDEDFDFTTDGHFIDAEFLASALHGEAEWDGEENTLMLRIRDKEAAEAQD